MKKPLAIAVLLFLLNLLQACDNSANSGITGTSAQAVHKGFYIYGHEVNSFQPCAQELVYWVNGSNELLEQLQQNYQRHSTQVYAEVYVELTGKFGPRATDGFAMDYDGQFEVTALLKMDKKSNHDCASKS